MDTTTAGWFANPKVELVPLNCGSAICRTQLATARHHNMGAVFIDHFFGENGPIACRLEAGSPEPLVIFVDGHADAPAKMAEMLSAESLRRNLYGHSHRRNRDRIIMTTLLAPEDLNVHTAIAFVPMAHNVLHVTNDRLTIPMHDADTRHVATRGRIQTVGVAPQVYDYDLKLSAHDPRL
jgi:hypothetical protein